MNNRKIGLVLFTTAALALTGATAMAHGKSGDRERGAGWIEAMDANSDGKVTKEEIEAHAAARFTAADTDGDGLLSEEELKAAADAQKQERFAKRSARMMERLDANEDGSLSAEEMASTDRTERMFERLDANGDGAIDAEEMSQMRGGKKGRHGGGDRETR